MTEAPERIGVRFNPSALFTDPAWIGEGTEYILLSAHEAAVAAARKDALSEVARDLRYRATEPGRHGISMRALVAAAMAVEALSKAEASK